MNEIDRSIGNRMHIKEIEDFISKFEIISFDVFDTLLSYKIAHPEGIFHYIEAKTKDKGFAQRRIAAEQVARKINFDQHESHETTLADIYKILYEGRQQQKQGIAQETDAERHFLTPFIPNKDIYKIARLLNKKIIAISDTHHSKEEIKKILDHNGISVDDIFCPSSSKEEYRCKSNGSLYAYICKKLNVSPEQIVHFGDDYQSDLIQCISAGIPAVHTDTALDRFFSDKRINRNTIKLIDKKENFESNIILGLMAKRHSEKYFDSNTTVKTFGYLYGGLLMITFIKSIIELGKNNGIEKLLLMTRDGFIIKRAMDALGISGINYDIFWSSRRMCLVPLLGMGKQYDWIFPLLFSPQQDGPYNLKKDMDRLHIQIPDDFPHIEEESYDIYIDRLKALGALWSPVVASERAAYKGYLNEMIADTSLSRIAFVDVGWGLSSHRALDLFLGHQINGFYLGTHQKAYSTPNIHGILFQEGKPAALARSIMSGVEIIELIFSDCSPSTIRMKKTGQKYSPVLETRNAADVARDRYVHEIHQSLMDFVTDISPYFSLLSSDTIKNMAGECISNIISHPDAEEKKILGKIPHACGIGHSTFLPISAWWHPDWTQEQKENFVLHGRILPKSEIVGRKILNPILGKKGADWLIKAWNRNKRKIKSYKK